MKFLPNRITDLDTWFKYAPPMGGEVQWEDGRSAKELAKYITGALPNVPSEVEAILSKFVAPNEELSFDAEYVTPFAAHSLGRGNGRNHDAIIYNDEIFVGVEGKADESFGNDRVGEAYEKGSDNKKQRIEGMVDIVFGDGVDNHPNTRYQLLTASAATLLEAKERGVKNAMFLILVFKKEGKYSQKRIDMNNADVENFLKETKAECRDGIWQIPTAFGKNNGVTLFFKKIEIEV